VSQDFHYADAFVPEYTLPTPEAKLVICEAETSSYEAPSTSITALGQNKLITSVLTKLADVYAAEGFVPIVRIVD
jgi:hypothetical protein